MGLFTFGLVWSIVGKVDVYATTQGKIIPSGRVKVIQPVETATIKAIHVQEGQFVQSGQLLIELDPADSAIDVARLRQEWQESRLDAARFLALSAFKKELSNPVDSPQQDFPSEMLQRHQLLLQYQLAEFNAQLATIDGERRQQEARLRTIEAEMQRLEAILPLLRERAEVKEKLAKQGHAPRMEFLSLERERVEIEEGRRVKQHEREEAQAQLSTIENKRQQIFTTFQQSQVSQHQDAYRRAITLGKELEKAEAHLLRNQLHAPETGSVQQLAVFSLNGVVTPAQELMKIVPADGRIEAETLVLNKDVGFVKVGQRADIKLETFDFTQFGTVGGAVSQISPDAITDQAMGLVYPLRIQLDQREMMVNGKKIDIVPGMAVTAEIATRRRRVIGFLLSPLLKALKESIVER